METAENELGALIAEIKQTPGVRNTVWRKGQLFIEGSLPLTELRRGKFDKVMVSALNRIRKQAKLEKLPFAGWVVEWHAFREAGVDYRMYVVPSGDRGEGSAGGLRGT